MYGADSPLVIAAGLQSEFAQVIKDFHGDDCQVQKWTGSLVTRYNEPQRYYHTMTHIKSMIQLLEKTTQPVYDRIALKLAIFFHDIIYDPTAHDNELQSVVTFQAFAQDLRLPEPLQARVAHYILATISHSVGGADDKADSDLHLFLDLDLEVLSRDWPDYTHYAAQIRSEYVHFGEREYCEGRIAVLKKFLLRERLYFSDVCREAWEELARGNLRREIKELEDRLQGLESV